jgi:hypothetical protein
VVELKATGHRKGDVTKGEPQDFIQIDVRNALRFFATFDDDVVEPPHGVDFNVRLCAVSRVSERWKKILRCPN